MPITNEGIVENQSITAPHEEHSIPAPIPVTDEAIVEPTAATLALDLDTTAVYDGALSPLTSAAEQDSKLQAIASPTASVCFVDILDHNLLDNSQMPSMANDTEQSLILEDSCNRIEVKAQDTHNIVVCSSSRLSLNRC